jgi:hypothetical protein
VATLLLLTAVAGGLDAITFLFVGGVFVCNQTGNRIFLATSLAGAHEADTAAAACSPVCFVVAAAVLVNVGALGRPNRAALGPTGRGRDGCAGRLRAVPPDRCRLATRRPLPRSLATR